jgi:probable HAF family extracellular repeat protein
MRSCTVLSAGLALALLACASEETTTEPASSPSLNRAAHRTYTTVPLGLSGGADFGGEAFAINAKGQVVGWSDVVTANGILPHAALWERGVPTDLGTLGGPYSQANGINASGQVVGVASRAPDVQGHAFLWEKGAMTDLGALDEGSFSSASAINSAGQVVGVSGAPGGQFSHAVLWTNGVITDLGTLGGNTGEATDINAAGQVVGTSTLPNGETHAFLWQQGLMSDLGTLGGTFSEAAAINSAGEIVGSSQNASGLYHAFLWKHGVMTDLGVLGGRGYSRAFGINTAGQVVGQSGEERTSAVLWENGIITEILNSPDFCCYIAARDINSAGQAVGGIQFSGGEPPFAVLWTRK